VANKRTNAVVTIPAPSGKRPTSVTIRVTPPAKLPAAKPAKPPARKGK
jgi:hypothetical protein